MSNVLTAADIDFGALSKPMPAAVKAARQVIAGDVPDDELQNTDTALASAFAVEHFDKIKWDTRRQAWMVCEPSGLWRPDATLAAPRLFQGWCEDRAFSQVAEATSKRDIAAVRQATQRTLTARAQRQLLDLARHQEPLADAGDSWDPNPYAFATAAGQFIDLKTGGIRALQPGDRITKACRVEIDPSARCDRFRRFVAEITNDDEPLIDLLTKALGYSMAGDINEQVFFLCIGGGANGKSTLLELIAYLLGDLAGTLPFSTLTRDRDTRSVQAEIADLPGSRFVRASEVREGAYLDEGRLKSLTGGDPMTVARKYAHPFTFHPTFKLWLAVNHRPRVSDRSHGFWRRAVPIPFERTFAGDKRLEHVLRDEGPGILGWLVDACLQWQAHGLPRPGASEEARQAWREGEDVIAQWAEGALVAEPSGRLKAAEAFKLFATWATAEGLSDRERPGCKAFGEWMAARFANKKANIGRVYAARAVTSDASDLSSGNLPLARAREGVSTYRHHHPSPVTERPLTVAALPTSDGGVDADRL